MRSPVARALAAVVGRRVLAGPFAGTRLDPGVESGVLMPRVLGTYEMEIRDELLGLLARARRRVVVNVGAADGYYAVGLLRAGLAERVVAFESLPRLRDALAAGARRNGVADRLVIEGHCTGAELGEALREHRPGLLLLDAEGAEVELLDPAEIPDLAEVEILAEIHPWVGAEAVTQIESAFGPTHRSCRIEARRPRAGDISIPFYRRLASLSTRLEARLLQERSAPTSWLSLARRELPARPKTG
ncbi:MAG: hypothetical protein F9K18_01200 [Thermoanaerobaculia bacterium]|nr:MAG: hypothetical protein F9K18_01200 [Thermoanaerobaculia bacterium]